MARTIEDLLPATDRWMQSSWIAERLVSATQDDSFADDMVALLRKSDDARKHVFNKHLSAVVELSYRRPVEVAQLVLAASQDALGEKSSDWRSTDFVRWYLAVDPQRIAGELATAVEVAAGICRGYQRAVEVTGQRIYLPGDLKLGEPTATSNLISEFVLILDLARGYGHATAEAGARRRLHQLISTQPNDWLALMPWLLRLIAKDTDLLGQTVFWAVEAGADWRPVLEAVAADPAERVRLRAAGLIDLVEHHPGHAAQLSALARLLDRRGHDSTRSTFPRPLSEPTSTWLSDLDLEQGFRRTIDSAVSDFATRFLAQAAAEEEGHVAALLTLVQTEMRLSGAVRNATGEVARRVQLTGDYRTIPKSEEKTINADLALLVRIDVPTRVRATFAELVQVKKSRLTKQDPAFDSWTIGNGQLAALLDLSPTATYWLLAVDGAVWAVPAKYLQAIAEGTGRGRGTQGSFTLYYSDVRHCAITLAGYLVDLLTGTWIGSPSQTMIEIATGQNAGTRPLALFELTIQSQNVDQ
jgi:hypothetical protein